MLNLRLGREWRIAEVDLLPGTSLYPLCQSEGLKEDRYQIVALLRPTWKVDLAKKRL